MKIAVHGRRFEERVYTAAELTTCSQRADRVQALASRFAAKEAFLKALGTGWARGLTFRQVEVVHGESGHPALRLAGAAAAHARRKKVKKIHVTLSHQPGLAAAVVILER